MVESNQQTFSTLCSLPTEIQLLILEGMADVPSLIALVHASPVFYRTYCVFRREVLPIVLSCQLTEAPSGAADLLMAVRSAELYSRMEDRKRNVIAFLDRYRRWGELYGRQIDQQLTWHECDAVLHLQKVADFIARDLLKTVENKLNKSDYHSKLSRSERHRISRAVYRWQIYSNMFGGRGKKPGDHDHGKANDVTAQFDQDEQADVFLAIFQPWEVEELASLGDYAAARYAQISSELARLFPWRDPFAHDKRLSEGFVNHVIGCGPIFLYQVLAAQTNELRCSILQHNLNIDRWTLSDALEADPFVEMSPSTAYLTAYERKFFKFRGDHECAGPNAAWVLADDDWQYSPRYQTFRKEDLRKWAYVMWDLDKLRPGGVFDITPFGLDASRL